MASLVQESPFARPSTPCLLDIQILFVRYRSSRFQAILRRVLNNCPADWNSLGLRAACRSRFGVSGSMVFSTVGLLRSSPSQTSRLNLSKIFSKGHFVDCRTSDQTLHIIDELRSAGLPNRSEAWTRKESSTECNAAIKYSPSLQSDATFANDEP